MKVNLLEFGILVHGATLVADLHSLRDAIFW
jgi:hypothetical protein